MDCGINELPKEIGQLTNLRKLWLENNNLTYLPSEICNLTQLEELYMQNNNIDTLPENIGNLRNLREINFKRNNIKSLPVSIILLDKLNKINFRYQKHGEKISPPNIASKILHGDFDNDTKFRKKILCADENKWNELKHQLRTKPLDNIYISKKSLFLGERKTPFLTLIAKIYGKEIAEAQKSNLFFMINKF